MSEKRRDNRNRILHNGESQRQDGRYAYKYKDINGETKFVYSWRLDKNDRAPAGKPSIAPFDVMLGFELSSIPPPRGNRGYSGA